MNGKTIIELIERHGFPILLALYLLFRLDGVIVDMRDSLRSITWTQIRVECLLESHVKNIVTACPSLMEIPRK